MEGLEEGRWALICKVHHGTGYPRWDVRDPAALSQAFGGADVVVHLAFMITGAAPPGTNRAINVDGTLNTFRAAAGAEAST